VRLDPTIVTSVAHTHFLRAEYEAALETYANTGYYLDAASWAALGDSKRAIALLSERLEKQPLSGQMGGSMRSLLAVLEGRRSEALGFIRNLPVEREPELVFYLARHLAMLRSDDDCVAMLQQAREQGMTSSYTLLHDDVFGPLHSRSDFQREVEQARVLEHGARQAFKHAKGRSAW